MKFNETNRPIEDRLQELKDVPARNPAKAARGRTNFLNQAAEYREAVSQKGIQRRSSWVPKIKKERYKMNILATILLVSALLFGGGATVAAAQNDLPNEPLYQVKTMTENTYLWLNNNPQSEENLLMQMIQERVREMIALNQDDVTIPAQVQLRLETHIQQALQIASSMEEPTMLVTLQQIRDTLRTQDRLMLQTHIQDCTQDCDPVMLQTQTMLQTRLHLVDQGLADPQGFKYAIQNGFQYGQDETISPEPNQQGAPNDNGQNGQSIGEPGGNGNGPNNQGSSEPGPNVDDSNGNGQNGQPTDATGGNGQGSGTDAGSGTGSGMGTGTGSGGSGSSGSGGK